MQSAQIPLPLQSTLRISDGLNMAAVERQRRQLRVQSASRPKAKYGRVKQHDLRLLPPPDAINPKARYPLDMVWEARKMRKYGWSYREIADAINEHWGTKVHLMTVRDWTVNAYRNRV